MEASFGHLQGQAKVRRKLDVRIIPWAWCIGVISYLDRTNLAFASVTLARDLGFDCATYGIASGLFFVGYGVFQVPSVDMYSRWGVPWLVGTVVMWGAVAVSFAAVRSRGAFFILRIVLGAVEAGTYPIILSWLSQFYDERSVGTAYSMAASSTALASVVGSPIAASILLLDGVMGFSGWQFLFMIEGVLSMTFGCYVFFFMPRRIEDVLDDDELRMLGHRRTGADGPHQERGSGHLMEVMRSWRPHYLGVVFALVLLSMYGCIFFIPLLINSFLAGTTASTYGGSTRTAASCDGEGGDGEAATSVVAVLLSAIPFATAAISMILIGKSSERTGERRYHGSISVLVGALLMGCLALATALGAPAVVLIVLLSSSAAGIWGVHAPLVSWPYAFLPPKQASAAFAVTNSWGSLGGFLGPSILGMLAQTTGSYSASLGFLAAGGVAAAIMLYLFDPPAAGKDAASAAEEHDRKQLLARHLNLKPEEADIVDSRREGRLGLGVGLAQAGRASAPP